MSKRLSNVVRTTFRSLRVRNFRLFFVGQLISQVGTWLTTIALTLLVLHLTNSGLAIGALVACQFGPVLLLGAYGGRGGRPLGQAAAAAHHPDARRCCSRSRWRRWPSCTTRRWPPSTPPPWPAGSCWRSTTRPAARSWPRWCPRPTCRTPSPSTARSMTSARIFGPALAGVLVVTVGYGWCFTIDAISYLAVIAGLWLMRTARAAPAARGRQGQGADPGRAALRAQRARPAGCRSS